MYVTFSLDFPTVSSSLTISRSLFTPKEKTGAVLYLNSMSAIVTHYTPKQWTVIDEHHKHDTAKLPNKIRAPAPCSEAWWYQQRAPGVEGFKSEQHRHNLQQLKECQHHNQQRLVEEKAQKIIDDGRASKLRQRVTVGTHATSANKLCVSPRRKPQIAIHSTVHQPKINPVVVRPGSGDGSRQVRPMSSASVGVASGSGRLGSQTATPRHVQVFSPKSMKDKENNSPPGSDVVVINGNQDQGQGGDGEEPLIGKCHAHVPTGMIPMEEDVRAMTESRLQQRADELEDQLRSFPLAHSVTTNRRKGIIQRELAQIQQCLQQYSFPVVMKKHSNPVALF